VLKALDHLQQHKRRWHFEL